jgi:hypothetical protein
MPGVIYYPLELFKQHDLDGQAKVGIIINHRTLFFPVMKKVAELEAKIEFIADINECKDCLMSQDSTSSDPACLWFNIDILKGHKLRAGDTVRVTVEKIED